MIFIIFSEMSVAFRENRKRGELAYITVKNHSGSQHMITPYLAIFIGDKVFLGIFTGYICQIFVFEPTHFMRRNTVIFGKMNPFSIMSFMIFF